MSITKQFTKYVTQNIFGMLGFSCYIIADTFFIAKAGGADGITVLNLVLPVYSIIFAIGSMIGVGSATRFAIFRAQGDKQADSYFFNSIAFVWLIGMIGVLAGIFFPDKIIAWMGGDPEIVALGTEYTRIFLLFTPFFMTNYIVGAFVRNDNDPMVAMIATLSGSFANIILDYVFMFPMGMGLAGAALATVAAPVLSISICMIHFFGKKNTIRFKTCRLSLAKLGQSCELGFPAFVGELSSGVTTAVYNFLILGLVGNVGVAAYGVIANYAIVATAIFNGIAQGAQPLVSRYYGMGESAEVKKIYKLGTITALCVAVLLILGVYSATDVLVSIFNSEGSELLAQYAHTGMRFYFTGFLFAGFNIVSTGFLSAVEQARASFLTSVLRGFVAITVFALLLSCLLGMNGVWLSFPAAELVTATVILLTVRATLAKWK